MRLIATIGSTCKRGLLSTRAVHRGLRSGCGPSFQSPFGQAKVWLGTKYGVSGRYAGPVLLSLSVPQCRPDKTRIRESLPLMFAKLPGGNSSTGVSHIRTKDQGRAPAQHEGRTPSGRELTSLNASEEPFW